MATYAYTWDPFRDAETMLTGVDRLIDRAWGTAGTTPGVNVYADDEAAVVTTELPGVQSGEVQVHLHDDVLTFGAERLPQASPWSASAATSASTAASTFPSPSSVNTSKPAARTAY